MIKETLHAVSKFVNAKSPVLLSALGVGMLIGACFTTATAVTQAEKLLEARRRLLDDDEELDTIDKIETCWTCFIPTFILVVVGTVCVAVGHKILNAKYIAAGTALELTSRTLERTNQRMVQELGENKAKEIQKAVDTEIAEEQYNRSSDKSLIVTGHGDHLCQDGWTGVKFRSNIEDIKHAINEINFRLNTEMFINLNEFYYELNLPPTGVGKDLGWNVDYGPIEIRHTTAWDEEYNEPKMVISYSVEPKLDYQFCHNL